MRIDARRNAAAGSSADGLNVPSHARGCARVPLALGDACKGWRPRGNPGFSKAWPMTSETLHADGSLGIGSLREED